MDKIIRLRIEDTQAGVDIPFNLYAPISHTVNTYRGEQEFPNLLAKNTSEGRYIGKDEISDFRREIDEAGKMILSKPFVNKYKLRGGNEETALEDRYTAAQAAIHMSMVMELCDEAVKGSKSIRIGLEDYQEKSELDPEWKDELTDRQHHWVYSTDAKDVFDTMITT